MLLGEPVLGRYPMDPVGIFYIQGDNDANSFMSRFMVPYGFDPTAPYAKFIDFYHLKNIGKRLSYLEKMQLLSYAAKSGKKIIVIDNKTSVFTEMVYGKESLEGALKLNDDLVKIAIHFRCTIVVLEHVRKVSRLEYTALLTPQDVLGTSSILANQVIGMSPKIKEFKRFLGVNELTGKKIYSKPWYLQIPGEGLIYRVKNAEGLETRGFKILQDSPFSVVFDEMDIHIIDEYKPGEEEEVFSETIAEANQKVNYLKEYLLKYKDEWSRGELLKDLEKSGTKMSERTLRRHLKSLFGVSTLGSLGGRGNKTKYKTDKDKLSKCTTDEFPDSMNSVNQGDLMGVLNVVPAD